jgi:sec-independent protein translocase protein TatA
MGMPGPLELGIILGICILLFGTKRVKQLGEDIGGAMKGFRKGAKEAEEIKKDLEV